MPRGALASAVALAALLAGCTGPTQPPVPAPTTAPTTPVRGFTIVTSGAPATFDPAAARSSADAVVALNVFSRLMVVHPDGAELKPDLATDCLYTSPTTYRCELPEGLTFHNGHALTSSDVKFSIERAYRLGVPRSSTRLLDSLQRVDVVDDLTLEFALRWADTQFGYALASPAAGIVDEELYDPDLARPNEGQAVGSGPYRLVTTAPDQLVFERFEEYEGALTGELDEITLRLVPDSAAAEEAMAGGAADVVWRSLDRAARERQEADARPTATPVAHPFTLLELPDARVQRLLFNPSSPWRADPSIRAAVALALQPDRSLPSLVPPGVEGAAETFPVGGDPEVPAVAGQRLRLVLAYVSSSPDQRDLAGMVRDRLEERAGISVQLVADTTDADLILTDRPAWVNTAFGWLQPFVDDPLPESAPEVQGLVRAARETVDAEERDALLAQLQTRAATDLTVLPISVGPETLYLADGVRLEGQPFGPGWQLGLWSFRT